MPAGNKTLSLARRTLDGMIFWTQVSTLRAIGIQADIVTIRLSDADRI